MSGAKPEHIKNIISSILTPKKNGHLAPEQDKILSAWAKTVNRRVLNHTRLTSIRKNAIVVSVDSSSWLYQLNLEKDRIAKKLNKLLGQGVSFKLYFRLGEV